MRYRPRFSIREVLLLMTVLGLALAMLMEHLSYRASVKRIETTWARATNKARDNAIILDNNGYFLSGDRMWGTGPDGELVPIDPNVPQPPK